MKTSGNKTFEIIPAIDIIEGRCVRLTRGDFGQKKIYNEKPLEVAMAFEDAGMERLHLVDLDGARLGRVQNWKVLEQIAGRTGLGVDFGGGVASEKDVEIVIDSGAALVTVGSIAVKDAASFSGWLERFGAERFFLGADVRDEKITISGWTEQTGISVYDFIEDHFSKGIRQVFCTDVSKDGLLQGPSVELYRSIKERFPGVHLVASGGVSQVDDLYRLQEAKCGGAIIGKAIYEGHITLESLSRFKNFNV